jgi:hypothetical protein
VAEEDRGADGAAEEIAYKGAGPGGVVGKLFLWPKPRSDWREAAIK